MLQKEIIDAWEGWEHNGWGVLLINEMLKEVKISIMPTISIPKSCSTNGEHSHCLCPYQSKKLFYRWGALPMWHVL
jgi:hypothetical protein